MAWTKNLRQFLLTAFTSDAKCTQLIITLQAKVFMGTNFFYITRGYANEMRSVVYRSEAEN